MTDLNVMAEDYVCVKRALANYIGHAPLDLLKPFEIQRDLAAITGVPHYHRASIGKDECALCCRDLRHECHLREQAND